MDFELSGKLPGKTKYSGRRRTATRRAGFNSHPNSTGGEYKAARGATIHLVAGEAVVVTFTIPKHQAGDVVAFGGWYIAPDSVLKEDLDSTLRSKLEQIRLYVGVTVTPTI
jgi:hypothetical protein